MKAELASKTEKYRTIIWWMCGVSLRESQTSTEPRKKNMHIKETLSRNRHCAICDVAVA